MLLADRGVPVSPDFDSGSRTEFQLKMLDAAMRKSMVNVTLLALLPDGIMVEDVPTLVTVDEEKTFHIRVVDGFGALCAAPIEDIVVNIENSIIKVAITPGQAAGMYACSWRAPPTPPAERRIDIFVSLRNRAGSVVKKSVFIRPRELPPVVQRTVSQSSSTKSSDMDSGSATNSLQKVPQQGKKTAGRAPTTVSQQKVPLDPQNTAVPSGEQASAADTKPTDRARKTESRQAAPPDSLSGAATPRRLSEILLARSPDLARIRSIVAKMILMAVRLVAVELRPNIRHFVLHTKGYFTGTKSNKVDEACKRAKALLSGAVFPGNREKKQALRDAESRERKRYAALERDLTRYQSALNELMLEDIPVPVDYFSLGNTIGTIALDGRCVSCSSAEYVVRLLKIFLSTCSAPMPAPDIWEPSKRFRFDADLDVLKFTFSSTETTITRNFCPTSALDIQISEHFAQTIEYCYEIPL
jgi:hypothetical protein